MYAIRSYYAGGQGLLDAYNALKSPDDPDMPGTEPLCSCWDSTDIADVYLTNLAGDTAYSDHYVDATSIYIDLFV